MCCMWLAENTGRKNDAKNRHLGTIPQLCRAIYSQLRHASTIGKNLLSSNISSTCPHNMVNFGILAAEIVSGVWGTPATFNGFRVLAALLHGSQVVSVSQTMRRHLCSAGRPSRWALAHISSCSSTSAVANSIGKSISPPIVWNLTCNKCWQYFWKQTDNRTFDVPYQHHTHFWRLNSRAWLSKKTAEPINFGGNRSKCFMGLMPFLSPNQQY